MTGDRLLGRAGRRGISRSRATSHPTAATGRGPPSTPARAGSRPRVGREGPRLALRAGAELRRRRRAAGRRSPRRGGGCGGCARQDRGEPPPPAPGEQIDRSDRERQERRQEHELDRPAAHDRARRGTRSSSCPVQARGPRRASRRGSGSHGRARPGGRWSRGPRSKTCDGRSGTVVSVTAGMPRATNGPCSQKVNGKPRSSSWRKRRARVGLGPGLLEHPNSRGARRAPPPANGPCRRRSAAAAARRRRSRPG